MSKRKTARKRKAPAIHAGAAIMTLNSPGWLAAKERKEKPRGHDAD